MPLAGAQHAPLPGLTQPLPTGCPSGSLGLRVIALQLCRSKGGNG